MSECDRHGRVAMQKACFPEAWHLTLRAQQAGAVAALVPTTADNTVTPSGAGPATVAATLTIDTFTCAALAPAHTADHTL